MKWKKLGLLFYPDKISDWMWFYAANPVVESLGDARFRVYFSCRDRENRSSIAYLEIDIRHPNKILHLSKNQLIGPGQPGLFDDSGASMGGLVNYEGARYLYYTGWNLSVTVPWRNSIGLAICRDDKLVFEKYSSVPILDRSEVDPYSLSYPWVTYENGIWKMWYGSNLRWGKNHRDMDHVIKYAQSTDGIHWSREGAISISLDLPDEWGVSKPCVISEDGIYKMWYSSRRGNTYRIGYAESTDGLQWVRMDYKVGIDVSPLGWDSEMIEYCCVFDHEGQRYMLYNGNGFGKTGFGLAVLEQD